MPDTGSESVWRGGRLLTTLFWFGVGLAPLAGLLLLLGGGQGSLRVAAVLAVLAVVLIGLSIALRPDASTVRLQLEEMLLEEVDGLREELRDEIATASRSAHQSFGERVGAVQQQVEALRHERATAPAAAAPVAATARAPAPPAPPPPIGRAQFTPPRSVAPPYSVAPPQQSSPSQPGSPPRSVAPPQSVAPPYSAPHSPPVSTPAGPPAGRPPVSVPAANGRAAAGASNGGRRGAGRRAARHQAESPRRPPSGRANVPTGVYRRTETVQVTRSTSYVDEPVPEPDRLYDTGYQRRPDDSQEWSTGRRGRRAEPYEESWTDQKLRERYGGSRRPRPYDTNGDGNWGRGDDRDGDGERWRPISAEPISGQVVSGHPISGHPVSAEPRRQRSHRWDDEEDSTGLRMGQRWAAVRADDRGRELEVGERRAARHSDDRGTELRIEDRWAAVRHEDNGHETSGRHSTNGRHSANGRHSDDHDSIGPSDYGRNGYERSGYGRSENGRSNNGRSDNGRSNNGRSNNGRSDNGRPDYGRPALPAGGAEPSWNDSWEEPVRQSRGHRYRDDETSGGGGYGSSTPRQRRLDFELSDERWR